MKTANSKAFLAKSIFLLWVIICFSLFFRYAGIVSHIHQFLFEGIGTFFRGLSRIKPFDFSLNIITAFFSVLIFTLSCTVFGTFILDLFGNRLRKNIDTFLSLLAYFGTAFLMGEIVVSSIFLLMGYYHLLTANVVILTMVVMIGVGIRSFVRLLAIQRKKVNFDNIKSVSQFDRFLFWTSVTILFLTLLYSSARLSYDAVGMYFSDAKIIAMTDHIQFFSDVFVVSSLHTGIQYAAIIQVFGDQAARMYSWIGGLVILVFSLAIGEKVGLSKKSLLFVQIMILTSTVFIDLMGDGKIDLQTSVPIIAAIYWILVQKWSPADRWLYFLIGLLAGFSIISRLFNAFLLFIFFGLFYFWQMYSRRKNGKWNISLLLEPTLGIGSGVFLLFGFHLLANQIIMGNLLAPFITLSRVNSSIWHYSYDPKDMWIYRLLYPFVVTYINSPQSLGDISPIFVAFVPSLFLASVRKKIKFSEETIVLSSIAVVTLILWVTLFYTIVEIRYVLFLWIILFLPASVILEKTLQIEDRFFQTILKFLLVALLLFIVARVIFISISTYSPVDKSGSPQCYDSPLCDFIRPLNEVAPEGARVLALNAYRYYMRTDLFACSSKADEYNILHDAARKGAESFWAEVYRQGYQYVVYENNFSIRHLDIDIIKAPLQTPQWINLEPVFGNLNMKRAVYKISVENPPVVPEKVCRKDANGIWNVEAITQ